jgi:hypothetical protein
LENRSYIIQMLVFIVGEDCDVFTAYHYAVQTGEASVQGGKEGSR